MRSSLASGKSSTPPARCIHRPQRDTLSAGYRLLVSRASAGASCELSSRRSPALDPRTRAVSPTFRYGAFRFVASALADLSSARLTSCRRKYTYAIGQHRANRRFTTASRGLSPPIKKPLALPKLPLRLLFKKSLRIKLHRIWKRHRGSTTSIKCTLTYLRYTVWNR